MIKLQLLNYSVLLLLVISFCWVCWWISRSWEADMRVTVVKLVPNTFRVQEGLRSD